MLIVAEIVLEDYYKLRTEYLSTFTSRVQQKGKKDTGQAAIFNKLSFSMLLNS